MIELAKSLFKRGGVMDTEFDWDLSGLFKSEDERLKAVQEFNGYINELKSKGGYDNLETELSKSTQSTYCSQMAQKYSAGYPVWVFIEIIPFGRLISFYMFLANKLKDKKCLMKHIYLKMLEN